MAKKNIKETATDGFLSFDDMMNNNKENKDIKENKDSKENKEKEKPKKKIKTETVNINFKVSPEIRDYLAVAAARESIKQGKRVSISKYFCDLVEADRKKHKND